MRSSSASLRLCAGVLSLIALAACGGGHAGSSLPATVATPRASAATARASMKLKMHIPGRTSSAAGRRATTISPSAAGLSVTVGTVLAGQQAAVTSLFDISTGPSSVCTSNADGSRDCVIALTAPVGSDVFSVVVYDQAPAGGTIPSGAATLGTVTTQQTIVSNASNTLAFSVGGLVATVNASPSQIIFTSGTAGTQDVFVTALDADGNIIIGSTADAYANAIAVTVSGSMFSVQVPGGSAASSVTLTSPVQNKVTVNYDGTPFGSAYQLQASATGIATATTSIVNSTGSGTGTVGVPGTTAGKLVALDTFGSGGSLLLGIPAHPTTSTPSIGAQPVVLPAFGSIAMDPSGTGTIYAIVPGTAIIDVLHVDASNPALVTMLGVIGGTATHLTSPAALAVGANGTLYVADAGNQHNVSGGSILAFAPASPGGAPAPILELYGAADGLSGSGPTSISVDATGNIFAFVPGSGVIEYPAGFPSTGTMTTFATDQIGKTQVAIAIDQGDAALFLVDGQEYGQLQGYCGGGYNCALIYAYHIGDASAYAQIAYQYNIAFGASRGIAEGINDWYLETTFDSAESQAASLPIAVLNNTQSASLRAQINTWANNAQPPFNGITADRETSGPRSGQVYYAATGGAYGGLYTPYGSNGPYSAANQVLQTFGSAASAVTVDSAGNTYVADSGTNSVSMYHSFPFNGYQYPAVTLGGVSTNQCPPISLATDSYQNLYVLTACGSGSAVNVYKPLAQSGGNEAATLTINLPANASPYQIAIDGSNRLFVSDHASANSAVYVYNASSKSIATTISTQGYGYPSGLAVSATGTLYVYCQAGGSAGIFAFKPSGTGFAPGPAIVSGSNTGLAAVTASLAADANGVYVANRTNILEFATAAFAGSATANVAPAIIGQSGVQFFNVNAIAVSP